ncbi:MAG: hypothetical protein FWG06_00685 [Clostridiales bacterium]|nr:hypothetical protein [Clostridiales bacterium]
MNHIDPLNKSTVTGPATEAKPALNDGGGEDFSALFNEAMMRSLTENTLSGLGGGLPAYQDDSFGYLQSMLLTGAAEGNSNGNEMLMYMLMCMMQEFKGSDMAPLMSAMSALMPAASAPNSYKPVNYAAGAYSAGPDDPGFLPRQAWLPTALNGVSTAGRRSAEVLNKVISQFKVESAERYRPYRDGNTYCNIFVWDVTRALGCEIPHYVEKENGDPRYYPNVKGAYELDANGTADWLRRRGADYGWREITAAEAQQYANAGHPVVSAWRNGGGGAGHVQMVCPSRGGGYDPVRGVTVAQAGKLNFTYAHIKDTMSADKIARTRYYVHA